MKDADEYNDFGAPDGIRIIGRRKTRNYNAKLKHVQSLVHYDITKTQL